MKTFIRLLQFAKPIEKFAIPFFLLSIISALFGVLNFAMLIPLLDLLFSEESSKSIPAITTLPEFSLSGDYFKNFFYYNLNSAILKYGKMGALGFVVAITFLFVILHNIFKYLSQRIIEDLKVHTLLRLRQAVFNKIINMHLGYFSNERKGVLISKLTGDVQVIQGSITNVLIVFFREPIYLIIYLSILFYYSISLTLFSVLIIPVSGFAIASIIKKLKESSINAQNSFAVMMSNLEEALSGIRIIKAFNATKMIENNFYKENLNYTNIIRSILRRQELTSPVSETLGALVVAGIILYGASLVIAKDPSLSASTFVAYIVIFSQLIRPVKSMTGSFGTIQHGIACGERILNILNHKNEVENKPDAIKIKSFEKEIEFKDVSFSYEGKKEVLRNISFKLPKGKTIALVGPSGGGKSTISDLIPRFYDPGKGSITIDGVNILDCEMESLRSLMGIVNQETILFNDTIFNNIAFNKSNVTKEEVIEAAKVANAHNFIMETTDGYETVIGDRGVKLSGGQKQRLSIARAVLINPPILLLDEATSALDTESERLVQEALNRLMKNRTSLVIAHRLSTIQNADRIIVIQNGVVVEEGTHRELIEDENGVYFKLSKMQKVAV